MSVKKWIEQSIACISSYFYYSLNKSRKQEVYSQDLKYFGYERHNSAVQGIFAEVLMDCNRYLTDTSQSSVDSCAKRRNGLLVWSSTSDMTQFELFEHMTKNWTTLHIHPWNFQITHWVKQSKTCQRLVLRSFQTQCVPTTASVTWFMRRNRHILKYYKMFYSYK